MFVRLCAAIAVGLVAGCATASATHGPGHADDGPAARRVAFTTTEFTRPYIEVAPDGDHFYFDVLGEIYRAPIEGGPAERMDLGDGWKWQPTLSRRGGWVAFNRDHARAPGVWVQRTGSDERFMALSVDRIEQGAVDRIDEPIYMHSGGREQLNLQTGLPEEVAGELPGLKGQYRASLDGRWRGYATLDGERTMLAVEEVATGERRITGCELDTTDSARPLATYAFIPGQPAVLLNRDGQFRHCAFDGTERRIPVSAAVDMALAPMLVPRDGRPARTQIRHPALAPRADELAFTARGRVWRRSPDGGLKPLIAGGGESLMPVYAPDGKSIAFVAIEDGTASLRRLDRESGQIQELLSSTRVGYANPVWSPDGTRLGFVEVDQRAIARKQTQGDDAIKYLSIGDGRVHEIGRTAPTPNGSHLYQRISWAPGGDGIYYTREKLAPGGGGVESIELLFHPLQGEPVVLLTMQPSIQAAVVSADGRHVALQERLGIAIVPLPHPSEAPKHARHISLKDARGLPRFPVNGPDYVWWAPDGQLFWSVQDEIFVGREWMFGWMSPTLRVARIALPESGPDAAETKVYTGARIITMTDDGVIEDGAIVTAGSKVRYVGPAAALPAAFRGARTVDISGKTVIPGLIDVHAHRVFGLDDLEAMSSRQLLAEVAYGVTTVFDPQVSTIKSAYLTDLSHDDGFVGPTFLGSGSAILGDRANGAHALIESADDARGYVERQAKAGAPLVKAYWRPSRQDRQWIVGAAREFGVGVASDENRTRPIQLGSVQDGYTAIEHGLTLQSAPSMADVIRFMKDSGTSITTTVAIGGNVEKFLAERTKPDMRTACLVQDATRRTSLQATQARQSTDLSGIFVHARNALHEYAEMLEAGARVSIGGHGSPPGLISHWEMWSLALGGATPMNVLKAATVNGAYKLGMQDRIGALAEGMDADFVILDANPLDDIHNTLEIDRVVRRGRVVQWPAGTRPPLSWPSDVDWEACKAWNFGVADRGG